MPDGSSLPEIKISELPVGTQANLTDQLEANQAGVTRSITVAQVATTVAGTLPAPPTIPTTLPPSGAAGGALSGTYPNPGLAVPYPTTLPPSGAAGGALAGTYPNPSLVGGPLSNYALISSLPTTLPPSGAAGGMLNGSYPNPGIAPAGTNGFIMTTVAGVAAWAAASGGASISVSDTPPATPSAGALWWNSVLGTMFIYFNDGNSSQWVPAAPSGANVALKPKFTTFLANGTWTPDPNMVHGYAVGMGGGQCGGNAVGAVGWIVASIGGASGVKVTKFFNTPLAASYAVTIGPGGASSFAAGGDTIIAGLLTAPGAGSATARVGDFSEPSFTSAGIGTATQASGTGYSGNGGGSGGGISASASNSVANGGAAVANSGGGGAGGATSNVAGTGIGGAGGSGYLYVVEYVRA